MIYLQLFFFSFLIAFLGKRKYSNIVCLVMMSVIFLLMGFRYGQGIDYFNYDWFFQNYKQNPYESYGMEPLYYLINKIVIYFDFSFQWVIFITSFINIFFVYKVISKFSKNCMFSVLIMLANYFLNFTSMIRQAVAMSIMIYAICCYFEDRHLDKYIIFVIIASLFHTTAFLCIFLPLFYFFDSLKIKNYYLFTIYSIVLMGLSFIFSKLLIEIITVLKPKYLYYTSEIHFNVMSCGLRYVISMLFIYLGKDSCKFEQKLLNAILVGNLFYFFINPFMSASRVTEYFLFLEIIYVPNVLQINKRNTFKIVVLSLFYLFLFCKDIKSYESLGKFNVNHAYEYPYINVFEKDSYSSYIISE